MGVVSLGARILGVLVALGVLGVLALGVLGVLGAGVDGALTLGVRGLGEGARGVREARGVRTMSVNLITCRKWPTTISDAIISFSTSTVDGK